MPIISTIGRRSLSVRLVIGSIYTILIVGAVTMVYPLMLMLSGSVKSETDHVWITPVPAYLWDDDILWMKYLEAKYGAVLDAEQVQHRPLGSWRNIEPPDPAATDAPLVDGFREFRASDQWQAHWSNLGDVAFERSLGSNARRYRTHARNTYHDLTAYSKAVGVRYTIWSQVGPPVTPYHLRRFNYPTTPNYQLLEQVTAEAPLADHVVLNLDGIFWQLALRPQWATVEQYNASHGTDYEDYEQVRLTTTPPAEGQAREDWSQFVRSDLGLAFIKVDRVMTNAYQLHLASRYDNDISQLNQAWSTDYSDFQAIPLPEGVPGSQAGQTDFAAFLKDENACPLDALSVHGPRQGFEQFMAERRGVPVEQVAPLSLPITAVDYADFQERKGELRWEFLTRNYRHVLDYLLLHGNGVRNTVIYCGLMILVTLTINPLAAYALSRYKPPSTYMVLLFCMVTMAFPPEVTMIPTFLLLKRFPLIALIAAIAVGVPVALMLAKWRPTWPDWIKGVIAGGVGLIVGFSLLPRVFGEAATSVSLLNTFWALILPGAANGFGIFLLKGFFDSLPQELYEAAELDGAGEFTKFWTITMSLSKPILAVLALQAFTAAYSEFLMALVIIPDPDMWTLMVWLFQLQSQVHPSVVYASLVIAAVPTLLIFLFCQNLIMRGIVVPVEK